jgi:hypothetical protein
MIKTLEQYRQEMREHWARIERIESTEDFSEKLKDNSRNVYNVMCDLLAEITEIDFEGVPDRRTRELFEAINKCENLIDKLRKE